MRPVALVVALAIALCRPAIGADLMKWSDLLGRPLPAATKRIAYGADPNQFADLFLPAGDGPFPLVLMVHGGCWQARVAKLTIMNYAAEDLQRRGFAVWNVEYRSVDQPGGGYPGTFEDVASAADALRKVAPENRLMLDHVVATGHSAGGHLALWLAARPRLPKSSPLYNHNPLPIAAVISLGGLPDLAATRARGDASCEMDAIDRMAGQPSPQRPDVYSDTSVTSLLPFGVTQLMIQGDLDPISPPYLGQAYVDAALTKHDPAQILIIPDTGHAELIAPGSKAWAGVADAFDRLSGRR